MRDELLAARDLLARVPEAGRVDEDKDGALRRLLLPTTRYLIYYLVDHAQAEVHIVLIWHASREAGEL